MKIKNYEWNGFGFPIIFEELPAVKVRGKQVPDVDWGEISKPIVIFICGEQALPFSGNQVKFIRMHLAMSLREFAKFMGVTHQSVMRWEEKAKGAAQIDAYTEIVLRIKVLRLLHGSKDALAKAIDKVDSVEELKRSSNYHNFRPLKVSKKFSELGISGTSNLRNGRSGVQYKRM